MMKGALLVALTLAWPFLLRREHGCHQQLATIDPVAQLVILKCGSSRQQLAIERGQPPGQGDRLEQRTIQILQGDPKMEMQFIHKLAAPVATSFSVAEWLYGAESRNVFARRSFAMGAIL